MKKLFQFVGLITLLFFSFYLNSTTKNVIKNMDDIMMQIKMNKNKYNRDRVDAIIIDKYIIPGISKKTVDENKSYENMRKYGKYDEDYYIYKYKLPSINLENNKDKIIKSGNKIKKMISINFIVNNIDDINKIIKILDKNEVKSTFFINKKLLDNHIEKFYDITSNKHLIGINNCDKEVISIIKNVIKQKKIYYYSISDNICKIDSIYNVGGIYINDNYYETIINNLKSGAIFTFKYNNKLINELDYIIKYIINRGYDIETLDIHFQE